MTQPKLYDTVPVYRDASGRCIERADSISRGPLDLVAECNDRKRRLDERERRLNIRAHKLDTRESQLDARTDSLAARENKFERNISLNDAVRKIRKLRARMDALEAEEGELRNLPAFYEADEGELQSPKVPSPEQPAHMLLEPELEDDDDDLDLGALPRTPIPPTSKRDPDTPLED